MEDIPEYRVGLVPAVSGGKIEPEIVLRFRRGDIKFTQLDIAVCP